jgi:hypothetical protein
MKLHLARNPVAASMAATKSVSTIGIAATDIDDPPRGGDDGSNLAKFPRMVGNKTLQIPCSA